MGVSTKSRSVRGRMQKNASINVTPFVDLMLVLLIVFMITAPMMTVDVPVNLPKAAGTAGAMAEKSIRITINQEGQFYLEDMLLERSALIPELEKMSMGDKAQQIIIRGDNAASYGRIVALLSSLSEQGYLNLSLDAVPQE